MKINQNLGFDNIFVSLTLLRETKREIVDAQKTNLIYLIIEA